MKETKKTSVAGRLFFTFGTILLISVAAVCVINFARDGRAFEIPLLSAVAGTPAAQTSAGTDKDSGNYKTIKYNKPDAKTSSKADPKGASDPNTSKSGKPAGNAAAQPVPEP